MFELPKLQTSEEIVSLTGKTLTGKTLTEKVKK